MTDQLVWEPLEYDPRYYIQTAKNNITSLGHVIAEAVSNADEAISRRAKFDKIDDAGTITIIFDPETTDLTVIDDGIGMTSGEIDLRLKRVGAESLADAERGFFHRGIREVFTALGESTVETVSRGASGERVYSTAVFHPRRGMSRPIKDAPAEGLEINGRLPATGTVVRVPLSHLLKLTPKLAGYSRMETQITDCVQVRPVLNAENRQIVFRYADAPPKRLRFEYPQGEALVAEHEVTIAGHRATLWAAATDKPIKSPGLSRQTRRNGILIRGKRAAYEVSCGAKLRSNPGMNQVFGELRMDDIEQLQRIQDKEASDEAQLIYKADRSGLNGDHPLVIALYEFIDQTFGPLVSELETKETKRNVSPDLRRQLSQLAKLINQAIAPEDPGSSHTPTGHSDPMAEPGVGPEPPTPPEDQPIPDVSDGIAFAYSRLRLWAGQTRTIKVWFDTELIAPGSEISVEHEAPELVPGLLLSRPIVPQPPDGGTVAEVTLTLRAAEDEGRDEVMISTGDYTSSGLPVHVRFKRASGFISQIEFDNKDWESGSAYWNPANGRVTVYVGRPEFRDAAKRAKHDKVNEPYEHPLFRQLVVESVREAALLPAAQRRAEEVLDDYPPEERRDRKVFWEQVLTEYYALDYRLRAALLKAFVEA